MIKAVETALCEARLKELELFCLEKARQSLKNPAPERNSTNPMSALAFLPSAAFPSEGSPGTRLLDPRGGALPMLWACFLSVQELCVVILFHWYHGPGMALPSDEARRKSYIRCLSSWHW